MKTAFSNFGFSLFVFGMLMSGQLCASSQVTTVYGTGKPSTGDAGTQLGCAQPPCYAKARTQQHHTLAPPRERTPEELEDARLQGVFAEVAGQEQTAKREEALGHPEAAAYWRGFFARRSGLNQEEAEIVKKTGAKYDEQFWAFQKKRHETILAVRKANPGLRMSRVNSPEIASLEEERKSIFVDAKTELLAKLGPKPLARLDSYALHRHDNAKLSESL